VNVQVVTDPDGTILWMSGVLAGRTHDLTAARRHRIIDTCRRLGIPVLADLGAGGTFATGRRHCPGKELGSRQKSLNKAHARLRYPVERGMAHLKTWRIFRKARLQPDLAHHRSQSRPHSGELPLKMLIDPRSPLFTAPAACWWARRSGPRSVCSSRWTCRTGSSGCCARWRRSTRERVTGYIDKGVAEGARLVYGGPGRPDGLAAGVYVRPSIFADVDPDSVIAQEEIFGPVLAVIPYVDDKDAVRNREHTVYGLNGAVFGESEPRWRLPSGCVPDRWT
jgi:hypothetical protein